MWEFLITTEEQSQNAVQLSAEAGMIHKVVLNLEFYNGQNKIRKGQYVIAPNEALGKDLEALVLGLYDCEDGVRRALLRFRGLDASFESLVRVEDIKPFSRDTWRTKLTEGSQVDFRVKINKEFKWVSGMVFEVDFNAESQTLLSELFNARRRNGKKHGFSLNPDSVKVSELGIVRVAFDGGECVLDLISGNLAPAGTHVLSKVAASAPIDPLVRDGHLAEGEVFQHKALKYVVTGFSNLGNTDYMNSVLQCLLATSQFKDLFTGFDHGLVNTTNQMGSGGIMAKSLAKVMDKYYSPLSAK